LYVLWKSEEEGIDTMKRLALLIPALLASMGTARADNERMSTISVSSCGKLPPATTTFSTTVREVYLYFSTTLTKQDRLYNDWLAPDGKVIAGSDWPAKSGTFCLGTHSLFVSDLQQGQLGLWQARVYKNCARRPCSEGELLFPPVAFRVSAPIPAVDDICRKGTWSNCGVAVKQALDKHPGNLDQLLHLAELWGGAYAKEYDYLRTRHRLERAAPDAEKLKEKILDHLNPFEVAKDKLGDRAKQKAIELALKTKFLAWAGTVAKWAGKSPWVYAIKENFEASDIATDYDELAFMDDQLQEEFALQLSAYLKPNWKDILNNAATAAGPQLRMP
jgi:hypothetical protein